MDEVFDILTDQMSFIFLILPPGIDSGNFNTGVFATHQSFICRCSNFGSVLVIRKKVCCTFIHTETFKFINTLQLLIDSFEFIWYFCFSCKTKELN